MAQDWTDSLFDEPGRPAAGGDWTDSLFEAPEPEPRGGDSITGDLAASWGVGSNMLLRGVGSLYGLATGNMDNAAVRQGESGMEYWSDRKSPTLIGAEEGRSSAVDAADGELAKFGTAIWETVKDPRLLASFVIEQAPMTVGPGAVGRAGAVGASALGAGAKTAGVVGTGGAIGAGAGLQAADVGERVYSDLLGLPAEMWEQNEDFQALSADIGPDEAMRELALEYARSAAQASGGLSVASQAVPGGSTIERVLGRGRGGPGGLLSRVFRGAAGEGAQEVIEEGGGQAIGNYALSQIDPNQKLTEGLGESAGLALVGGGVLGGTAGLAGAGAEAGPQSDELAASAELAAMRQRDLDAEAEAAAEELRTKEAEVAAILGLPAPVYRAGTDGMVATDAQREAMGREQAQHAREMGLQELSRTKIGNAFNERAALDAAAAEAAAEARAQGGDNLDALLAEQEVYMGGETAQAIEREEQELLQALSERQQQRQQQAMEQSWKGVPQQTPATGFEGGSDLVPGADQSPGRFGRTGQPQQTEALSANLDGTGRVLVGDGTQDQIFSRRMAEALEREDQGMARARDERGYRQIGLGMPEREVPADPEGYQGGPAAREQVEQGQVARLEKLYEETRAKMPEREKGNQTIPSVDMDVLQYIASAGGINLEEGRARGFDSGDTGKRAGGIARVFTAKGQTFDEMAERMAQDGFFEGRDYSPNELETMVRRAMGGEMIFSPRSEKAGMTAAIQADLDRIESAIAGIENNRLEDADSPPRGPRWQAESDPMRQMIYTLTEAEAVGVPQRDIDRILDTSSTPEQADASLRQEIELEKQFRGFWFGPQTAGTGNAEGTETALGGARPQEKGRGQEAAAEGIAPPLELTQETEQQRADRERTQRETRERESTAAAEAEQRARADAEVGDFALSGSDRPADANANQVDLLDSAANQAATSPSNNLPEPTEAQIEAGNYKKGKVRIQGMDVSIENPKGSTRSGTRPDGSTWSNTMGSHYGYIRRTEGADGEHVDAYIGPNPDAGTVYVIDQPNQDGSFDEHKAMIGYGSQSEAEKSYLENYDEGWTLGPVTAMPVDQFKQWLQEGDTKSPAGGSTSKPTLRAAQEKKAAEKAAAKLNDITITETMLDESGAEVTVEQSAAVALRLIDKRLQVLDQLLGCVTGST